jgi:O-antigen ligase
VTCSVISGSFGRLMNREVVDKWCERGILILVLAVLVYGPLATGAVRPPDFLILQALTMGVMLLWILRLWLNPRSQLLWPPICWSVVAFTLYTVARYLTADIEYVARMEMVRVLVYAFLFLAILNNLYRQEFTQTIVFTLVFLAMAISFYAIYQFLTDSDRVWNYITPYQHRGTGTYISPNNLGGFLEMVLPLGLAWVLVSRSRPVAKVFVGYASLVALAGIAVTVSRGSWIAVGLVLIVLFGVLLFHRSYRLPALVLLIVIVGVGAYCMPRTHFFQVRLRQLTANGKFGNDARFDLWSSAVHLWRQDPWWGIGPDHFNYRFRAFRPETEQLQPDRVHNDYLNTLTDYGVVGTTLVLSAWILLGIGAARTWRVVRGSPNDFGARKSNKFALVLGASLGLMAILIHSVVDFNMHIPANAIVAVTLIALLSSCLRFTTDKWWINAGVWIKVAATLILLAGLAYLGWQGRRRAVENYWLAKASRAPNYSPAQAAALERAFAVEPMNAASAYAIGEAFRVQSWEGGGDYEDLAKKAMRWFAQSMILNPYDGYSYLHYGMCLDWLDQTNEALPYFDRAVRLDPNGYFTAAYMGWHYYQVGDYAATRVWCERSLRLQWKDNPIAAFYLQDATRRMLEAATNGSPGALQLLAR